MKKRFLLTSALMLLLTVLALTSATYAWFSMATVNEVKEFTMTAMEASGGLEISLDGQRFSNGQVEFGNPALKALDVTSTDGKTFYKQTALDANGRATGIQLTTGANQDYLEFKIYFRASNNGIIRFKAADSYIRPDSLNENWKDTENNNALVLKDSASTRQSSLGVFTRDWIAAATRMSFEVTGVQQGLSETYSSSNITVKASNTDADAAKLVKIFEPFKKITLTQNTLTNQWSLGKEGTTEIKYYPAKSNGTELDYENAATMTLRSLYEDTGATDVKLISINGGDLEFVQGNITIVEVTVRIWIEGQDQEAKVPLAGGQFDVYLKFDFFGSDVDNKSYLTMKDVARNDTNKAITFAQLAGVTGYEVYELTREGAGTELDPYVYTATAKGTTNDANATYVILGDNYSATAVYLVCPIPDTDYYLSSTLSTFAGKIGYLLGNFQ